MDYGACTVYSMGLLQKETARCGWTSAHPASHQQGSTSKRFKQHGWVTQVFGPNARCQFIDWSSARQRCSPISFAGPKRYTQPPCNIQDLPKIVVVILSHNHYDHLDYRTVMQLERYHSPHYVVSKGNKKDWPHHGHCLVGIRRIEWTTVCMHAMPAFYCRLRNVHLILAIFI